MVYFTLKDIDFTTRILDLLRPCNDSNIYTLINITKDVFFDILSEFIATSDYLSCIAISDINCQIKYARRWEISVAKKLNLIFTKFHNNVN